MLVISRAFAIARSNNKIFSKIVAFVIQKDTIKGPNVKIGKYILAH